MDRLSVTRHNLIALFVVFGLWEVAKHLLLMRQPMWVQHISSTIIEIALALVILVTALRAMAAEHAELMQTRAARDMLVTALANDLREPLVAVTEALREIKAIPGISERSQKVIHRATESVRPLVGMAVELLGLTSSSDGREQARPLNPLDLLRAAARTIQPIADASEVRIESEIAPELPAIKGQPHSLLRVLMILLDDAVRSTPNGGSVSLATQIAEMRISVSIADGGPAFNAEEKQVLDGRGVYRGGRAWEEKGTARSGLRYCAAVVQAHGGSIQVQTPEAGGNIVTLFLPLAETPGQRLASAVRSADP